VIVVGPEGGASPVSHQDRTRDALKLARLLAAGQLRPVVVPAPELGALRDRSGGMRICAAI